MKCSIAFHQPVAHMCAHSDYKLIEILKLNACKPAITNASPHPCASWCAIPGSSNTWTYMARRNVLCVTFKAICTVSRICDWRQTCCVTDKLFFAYDYPPFPWQEIIKTASRAPINSNHKLTYSWYERRCKGIIWKPKQYTRFSYTWIANQ